MPNHLQHETSPYLLQHADNPVDWYPWSEAAFALARQQDKPIFLSIGYAACHWCHVMAHESFEDAGIADWLNRNFISIKVDREEHPEVDNIYMAAVVGLTGQGGWPMTLFLTPDLKPFFAGTYFPPTPRYGMPAFSQVIQGIQQAWQEQRQEVLSSAEQVHAYVRSSAVSQIAPGTSIQPEVISQALKFLEEHYDWQHGGWGNAPKFPQPMIIDFLLTQSIGGAPTARPLAEHALTAMAAGGMYDIVGGGFHRYSTDANWQVPHYEKMLYDNAQLALAYVHAYMLTGHEAYRRICETSLDFILREMTTRSGGFISSLDADSEGGEGSYYLWSLDEIKSSLTEKEFERFHLSFDLVAAGEENNKCLIRFSDSSNAKLLAAAFSQNEQILEKLALWRARRIHPPVDEKVICSWNALALRSLAEAGRYLHRGDYLLAAQRNADFLLSNLQAGGKLYRTWRNGYAQIEGSLEDYASLAVALLQLYQADFNLRWFDAAGELSASMQQLFANPQGGFFDVNSGRADLLIRPAYLEDSATPSGNALAVQCLLLLSSFSDRPDDRKTAEQALLLVQEQAGKYPLTYGCWLQGLSQAVNPGQQVAILYTAGKQSLGSTWEKIVDGDYNPYRVVAACQYPPKHNAPGLFTNCQPLENQTTAFYCQGFVCRLPVTRPEDLAQQLAQ